MLHLFLIELALIELASWRFLFILFTVSLVQIILHKMFNIHILSISFHKIFIFDFLLFLEMFLFLHQWLVLWFYPIIIQHLFQLVLLLQRLIPRILTSIQSPTLITIWIIELILTTFWLKLPECFLTFYLIQLILHPLLHFQPILIFFLMKP